MGQINDLFPAVDVPSERNLRCDEQVCNAVIGSCLKSEGQFGGKVVGLEELVNVRHSVLIIGGASNGKTEVWHLLSKSYAKKGTSPTYIGLNPKTVKNNDLFGFLNPATRDWENVAPSNKSRPSKRSDSSRIHMNINPLS